MTFEEILDSDMLRLPIKLEEGERFETKLYKMLTEVHKIVWESDKLSDLDTFSPDVFKQRHKVLTEGVLMAIENYYDGSPVNAYMALTKAIRESNFYGYLPPNAGFYENSSFYRIRALDWNSTLRKEDLFHVPFNMRRRISTQRYSIPGYPTLYLSSSLYVAWEEMRKPEFNKLHAVRLENKKYLRCIDLTTDRYKKSYTFNPPEWMASTKEADDLYRVMAWPVIAACSFRVAEDDKPFKPEYIIPQLLLQHVKLNPDIDGIKFSSSHIDLNNENVQGDMYNLAIPVQDFIPEGYCPILKEIFQSTEVLTAQSMEISSAGGQMWSPHKQVEETTQTIEMVKGIATQYPYTKFGRMESNLLHMQVGPID